MPKKPYHDRIVAIRKGLKLTQADVADRLHIGYTTLGKVENGQIDLTIDRAIELAQVYNVSLSDLLNIDDIDAPTDPLAIQQLIPTTKPTHMSVVINIGGEGQNSPKADAFIDRIGKLLVSLEHEDDKSGKLFAAEPDEHRDSYNSNSDDDENDLE